MTDEEWRGLISQILDQYRFEVLGVHEAALCARDVGSTEYYRALARAKSVAVYRLAHFE